MGMHRGRGEGGGRTNNNANIIIIEITAKFIESRSLQVLNEPKKMPSWLDFVSALRKSRVNSVQIDKISKNAQNIKIINPSYLSIGSMCSIQRFFLILLY